MRTFALAIALTFAIVAPTHATPVLCGKDWVTFWSMSESKSNAIGITFTVWTVRKDRIRYLYAGMKQNSGVLVMDVKDDTRQRIIAGTHKLNRTGYLGVQKCLLGPAWPPLR